MTKNFCIIKNKFISNFLGIFITFNFVNISFIFFRSNNFDSSIKIIKSMFNWEFKINYIDVNKLNIFLGSDMYEFFFIFGNKIFSNSDLISTIYERNKDEDGFLYCTYSQENIFGF